MSGNEIVSPVQSGEADHLDDRELIKSMENAGKATGCQKGRIHRVPPTLKESKYFPTHYAPRVVSIGPYHHAGELRKEEIKLEMAKDFARNYPPDDRVHEPATNGWRDKIQSWNSSIKARVTEWRECYDDKNTLPNDDLVLARMMLLDGCFVLQYVKMVLHPDHEKYFGELKMKRHELAFVQQDLLLLENQLPFGVLKILMSNRKEQEWERKFQDLFLRHNHGSKESKIRSFFRMRKENPSPPISSEPPCHLLDFLRKFLVGEALTSNPSKCCPPKARAWHSFRNVKELNAAGIDVRPGSSSYLKNVSYTSTWIKGYVKLPPITVDDSTAAKFLNLIAYEMCPGGPDDFAVTSYVCFLDSLIDHPDDVKQLRYDKILINCLGSDQELADLFNAISNDLVPNSKVYEKVLEQIQGHYENKVRTWVAQFVHDHFSTPWTVLAFMAATIGLIMTGIQSYYVFFPSPGACEQLCARL